MRRTRAAHRGAASQMKGRAGQSPSRQLSSPEPRAARLAGAAAEECWGGPGGNRQRQRVGQSMIEEAHSSRRAQVHAEQAVRAISALSVCGFRIFQAVFVDTLRDGVLEPMPALLVMSPSVLCSCQAAGSRFRDAGRAPDSFLRESRWIDGSASVDTVEGARARHEPTTGPSLVRWPEPTDLPGSLIYPSCWAPLARSRFQCSTTVHSSLCG